MVDSYSTQAIDRCMSHTASNQLHAGVASMLPFKVTLMKCYFTRDFMRGQAESYKAFENKNSPNLIYFWIKEFQRKMSWL